MGYRRAREKAKTLLSNRFVKWAVALVFVLLFVPWLVQRFIENLRDQRPPKGLNEDQPQVGQISANDAARKLAIHLGTGKDLPWWKTLSEDDVDVFRVLKPLTRSQFNQIAAIYAKDYTHNRDLASDVLAYLDEDYYGELTHLFDVVQGENAAVGAANQTVTGGYQKRLL